MVKPAPNTALSRLPRAAPALRGPGPHPAGKSEGACRFGSGERCQGQPDLSLRTALSLTLPSALSQPEPFLTEEEGSSAEGSTLVCPLISLSFSARPPPLSFCFQFAGHGDKVSEKEK